MQAFFTYLLLNFTYKEVINRQWNDICFDLSIILSIVLDVLDGNILGMSKPRKKSLLTYYMTIEMTEEQVIALSRLSESCGKIKGLENLRKEIQANGFESDLKKRSKTYLLKKMDVAENVEIKEFMGRVKHALHLYSVDPSARGRYLEYVVCMVETAIPEYYQVYGRPK